MNNRDIMYALEEYEQVDPDFIKRQPAVEYGYDRKEKPDLSCADNYQFFERSLRSMYGG